MAESVTKLNTGAQAQLEFEGMPVRKLRLKVQAGEFLVEAPLKIGDKGRIEIEYEVVEVRHARKVWATGEREQGGRVHVAKPLNGDLVDDTGE